MQTVMSDAHYVSVVKTCIETVARAQPGAVQFFLIVDPDGVVPDVVAAEVTAFLNGVNIDVGTPDHPLWGPVFDCRHQRLDRKPMHELAAHFDDMWKWLNVTEVVGPRARQDFGGDATLTVPDDAYNSKAIALSLIHI